MNDLFDTTGDSIDIRNKKVKQEIEYYIDYEHQDEKNIDISYDNEGNNDQYSDYDEDNNKKEDFLFEQRKEKLENRNRKRSFSRGPNKEAIEKMKKGEQFTQFTMRRRLLSKLKNEELELKEICHIIHIQNKLKEENVQVQKMIDGFESIGLVLNICANAKEFSQRLDYSNKSFLIDLIRLQNFSYFKIFLGENTIVYISDIDYEHKQILLLVKEPQRTFKITTREYYDKLNPNKYRNLISYQTTPAEERRILIGNDEDHPFMCLLPELVNTVKDAHEALKPNEIKKLNTNQYKRQGEWFLVETNVKFPKKMINRKEGVANGKGRPHKISQLVEVGEKDEKKEEKERYFKGYISHPDHKNIKQSKWTRIYSNTERIEANIKGSTWID